MLAIVLVGLYGANESNVFFAIMGAMVVMEPTFKGAVVLLPFPGNLY